MLQNVWPSLPLLRDTTRVYKMLLEYGPCFWVYNISETLVLWLVLHDSSSVEWSLHASAVWLPAHWEQRELTSPEFLLTASYRLVVWRYELDITRQKWPGPESTPRWWPKHTSPGGTSVQWRILYDSSLSSLLHAYVTQRYQLGAFMKTNDESSVLGNDESLSKNAVRFQNFEGEQML